MISLRQLQKRIYKNKVKKGFNTTDIYKELCLIYDELAETFRAYHRKLPGLGEELADVAIYLLGLSEMLKVDLEKEIKAKLIKNEKRVYRRINGVMTRIEKPVKAERNTEQERF